MRRLLPWLICASLLGYIYWQHQQTTPPATITQGSLNTPTSTGPSSYAPAVKAAAPAVVNIYTKQKIKISNPFMDDPFFKRFFGEMEPSERNQSSLGSGVIISQEGYVLTNNHVVAQADEIIVALKDGRETKAKVIGTDPGTDLAVLRIDLKNLPTLPLRKSDMEVGDVVLAIGNPFGVGQTVTQGIISALGRQGLGINAYEDFIQTDAAINPGNSGGALIDVSGQLVGINTAIYSRSGGNMGIGFAIPVKLVESVMNSIIKNGKVIRGWLGVEIRDLNPEIAEQLETKKDKGAVIAGIVKNGPADLAGLEPGDIILSINNIVINTSADAVKLIAGISPNSKIDIVVLRDNKEVKLNAKIAERPNKP